MSDIEQRIQSIEKRNAIVAKDKAWETSLTRRMTIVAVTYLCAAIVFIYILPQPQWYLSALVPVAGYALSTLGLPWVRSFWERSYKS